MISGDTQNQDEPTYVRFCLFLLTALSRSFEFSSFKIFAMHFNIAGGAESLATPSADRLFEKSVQNRILGTN